MRIVATIVLMLGCVFAQPKTELENRAWLHLSKGNFEKALELYTEVVAVDSTNFAAHLARGQCMKQLGRHDESLEPFLKAYKLDSLWNSALYLFIADGYMYNLNYLEASRFYDRFLSSTKEHIPEKELARKNLRKAQWAYKHLKDSIQFRPVNLGANVNGPGEDYNAFLTADDETLYFNSHRNGCVGGQRLNVWKDYGSDFYTAKGGPGTWRKAVNIGQPVNTNEHEKEFWLSPDGRKLFYGVHPLYPSGDVYDCDIYYSEKQGDNWQTPVKLPAELDSDYCDSWPSLSANGKDLYFISNRPGGFGGFDVWVSHQTDSGWSKPINPGININTPGDEFDVFIHPDDSTLYFTSDYHDGFGGYDIFMSRRTGSDKWTKPVNLGYPLNTPWDEFDMFINAAGTTGYINSNRWGGFGAQDLYSFSLDNRIRPRSTVYLKGRAYDEQDTTLHPLANIWIVDLDSGDTLRQIKSNGSGFLFSIPTGKSYAALTLADSYLPDSRHFKPDKEYGKHYQLEIPLRKIKKGASFTLNNVFFDTDMASLRPASITELNVLKKLMGKYPTMQIRIEGHTDSDGDATYNQGLSLRRAEAVRNWLQQNDIQQQRLSVIGYGETRPVAVNVHSLGKQQNRRVSVTITVL